MVEILIAALALAALGTYSAVVGFMVFAAFVRLHERGCKLTNGWRVSIILALCLAVVGDVIYNATVGTWRYRELPRELAYSGRVRRHFKNPDRSDWRTIKAVEDADLLNTILPGHILP